MLNPHTTRRFIPNLYRGMLRTVVLNKRGINQQQSTGQNLTLYQCRQKKQYYGGQNLNGDMTSNDYCIWQIPRTELDRVGVENINIVDQITDVQTGEVWQPESDDIIVNQLFTNVINVPSKRRK